MGSAPKSPEQPGLSNKQIREIEGMLKGLGNSLTQSSAQQRNLLTQQRRLTQRQTAAARQTARQTNNFLSQLVKEQQAGEQRRQRSLVQNSVAASDMQRRIDISNQNATNRAASDYMKAVGTSGFNVSKALNYLK